MAAASSGLVGQYVEGHADHAADWTVVQPGSHPGQAKPLGTCMACIMVMLEDPSILTIKKKLILAEMLRVLGYHGNQMESVLAGDLRVTAHAALLLLDLMKDSDTTFVAMASEALVQLLCLSKSEEVVCCVLDSLSQQCLKVCNYRKSVPIFNLVGKLLQSIPLLPGQLLYGYASFLDYACAGLEYPDDEVQGSLSYMLMLIYSSDVGPQMSAGLSQRVARGVLHILTRAHSEQLQMNGLGLLRSMLHVDSIVEIYMSMTDGPSLPSALKKLLLLKHEMLPVAVVQSVTAVLQVTNRGQLYAELLLQQDMAEFLFEALTTSNELLLGSIFCCLSLFADVDTFFTKCHAVYGIESMLHAVEQAEKLKSPQVLADGLSLLAKILDRPPGSVRLFSHAGLICQCLRVLCQTVDHHNQHVYLQAVKLLHNLLRRDHLLSTVLYSDILQPLEVMATSMAQYPRMHCMPSDGKLQGKNQTDHPEQAARSQQKSNSVKAFMAQQRILNTFAVLRQACRLAEVCLSEPLADTSSFTQQKDGDIMLQEFIARLLQICDEMCIPSVLSNVSYVSDYVVYEHLYGMLNLLLHLTHISATEFADKLVASGFISVTLSLRSTLRAAGTDESEIVGFLHKLWRMSVGGELAASCGDSVRAGLEHLQGGVAGLLSSLRQNSAEPCDHHLHCSQWAALSIIHIMYTANDWVLTREALYDALLTYIDLHCNELIQLPPLLIKQLVFLLAQSSSPEKQSSFTHGESVLLGILKGQSDNSGWWTSHPALLWWCFSSEQITAALGTDVVSLWLTEEVEDESNRITLMAALAQRNDPCLRTVLQSLVDGSDTLALKCAAVLKDVVQENKNIDGMDMTPIHSLLSDILLRMLLIDGGDGIPEKLSVLLELICSVTQALTCYKLQDVDLKLTFHVSNLISKNIVRSELLDVWILNYLVCILVHSANQEETRVASVLLSNKSLLALLVDHLEKGAHTPAISLLALLLYVQHKYQVEAQCRLEVESTSILHGMTSHRPALALAAIQLWSSWFQSYSATQFLTIKSLTDHGTVPHGKDLMERSISDHDLCLLVINLQQSLLQEGSLIPDAAVACLQALFVYLGNDSHLVKHFVGHPWMNMLVKVFFNRQEGRVPPNCFLHLCTLLIAHGGTPLNEKQMQKLALYSSENEGLHFTWSLLLAKLLQKAHMQDLFSANEEKLCEIREHLKSTRTIQTEHRWRLVWLDNIIEAIYHEDIREIISPMTTE